MPKILTALFAALLLTGCASTGPQTVAGMGHGPDRDLRGGPKVTAADVAGSAQCYGDGQEGPRVQAVYVVAADRTDRYGTIASSIRLWAANMDQAVNDSAALDGGTSHIRWACTGGVVDVAHVNVGATEDNTFAAVRSALASRGYNRTDRKYVIWADTTDGGYCGISQTYSIVDYAPTYGQVNAGCWGQTASVELHEMVHGLGAVNAVAPHDNGSWHCYDESDRMCYNDGSGGPAMIYVCSSAGERLLDCNHDDYANWKAGSTLPHNIATSAYLESTFGGASPTPTPTSSSPTPTTPSPTPTTPVPTPTSPTPTVTPTVTPTPTPSPTPTVKCPGKSNKPACRSKRVARERMTSTFWHAGRAFRLLRF